MMGSFGEFELFLMLIIWFLPMAVTLAYFIWLGIKINQIAKAQSDHSRHMREIIKLLQENPESPTRRNK